MRFDYGMAYDQTHALDAQLDRRIPTHVAVLVLERIHAQTPDPALHEEGLSPQFSLESR